MDKDSNKENRLKPGVAIEPTVIVENKEKIIRLKSKLSSLEHDWNTFHNSKEDCFNEYNNKLKTINEIISNLSDYNVGCFLYDYLIVTTSSLKSKINNFTSRLNNIDNNVKNEVDKEEQALRSQITISENYIRGD